MQGRAIEPLVGSAGLATAHLATLAKSRGALFCQHYNDNNNNNQLGRLWVYCYLAGRAGWLVSPLAAAAAAAAAAIKQAKPNKPAGDSKQDNRRGART